MSFKDMSEEDKAVYIQARHLKGKISDDFFCNAHDKDYCMTEMLLITLRNLHDHEDMHVYLHDYDDGCACRPYFAKYWPDRAIKKYENERCK